MRSRVTLLTVDAAVPGVKGDLEQLTRRFGELPPCVRAAVALQTFGNYRDLSLPPPADANGAGIAPRPAIA